MYPNKGKSVFQGVISESSAVTRMPEIAFMLKNLRLYIQQASNMAAITIYTQYVIP
jgi:hypothetical protein